MWPQQLSYDVIRSALAFRLAMIDKGSRNWGSHPRRGLHGGREVIWQNRRIRELWDDDRIETGE